MAGSPDKPDAGSGDNEIIAQIRQLFDSLDPEERERALRLMEQWLSDAGAKEAARNTPHAA